MLFALIFDKHYIGIATFINLFLLGYITQFTYEYLQTVFVNPSITVRIITDVVCVVLGVLLFLLAGGKIEQIPTIAGIGTIITAFFMGPLIEFFNAHIARPFLKGKTD